MFTFSRENKFLIGQSTNIFTVKTGFEQLKKSKQNLAKKIFGDHQIFWWFGSLKHDT
jgi:hypothetical protein